GRGAWIFPVEHGVRLVGDSIEYAVKELPRSNPVSICGYHIRESGATPAQEIAYAFEIAKAYIDNVVQRGIKPEEFVGRFSFNFNVYGNLWEQIAKFRAARKLWAKMLKNEYGVTEKKKLFLRGLFGGGGSGLTKEQPENNIMRGAYYALGAALSGAQTIALCSFDEAYTIPTPRSALLSLRTLEMLMDEVGLRDTVDPLAGSYFIETITLEMEEKILEEMKEVEDLGGMVKCISTGLIQRKVSSQAYEYEKGLQSGEYRKVGITPGKTGKEAEQTDVELHEYNEEWAIKSKAGLKELRRTRNDQDVNQSLKALEKAAGTNENVMPYLVKCCHAYATVGEMAGVFRQTFGEWNEPDFY
ncbi:MAG: methylmalonyl-CoA mutase, partial [Deltaproteobacteria bacterium]|nr:methylmalonyl-CoA mutase [Deltaproteobacteria bacterium]